jgi:hypothetical protein
VFILLTQINIHPSNLKRIKLMAKKIPATQEEDTVPEEISSSITKQYTFILYTHDKSQMIVSTIPDEQGEKYPVTPEYLNLKQGDIITIDITNQQESTT